MKRLALLLTTLAMLIAPASALRAATLAPGDLIKASGPAVYYYAADGKRYVFPNDKTYFTWYRDFSNIKTISNSELAAITIGGNVTYRPGVKMIKLASDPRTYVVDGSKTLRWVKTEALAVSLYGSDWAKNIDDLPDAFFMDYDTGTAIGALADYDKTNATEAKPTIGSVLTVTASTQSETTISATVGKNFTVELPANPTTGYSWTAAFAPSKFTQVSDTYTASSPTLIGSGGTERFTYTPLVAGTWDLVFSYARSWETGVAPIDVRTYHVNVTEPTTPTVSSTTPNASFTLTPSKTSAQGNESLDLLASTNYTGQVTKIEIYIGDTIYASCDNAKSCSTSWTLPTIGLPDNYAYTAKFYTGTDGIILAHASTKVTGFPENNGILLTLEHPQLKPGEAAGIRVQLAAGTNASKIGISVDGMDLKVCSSNPQSCRYDNVIAGDLGSAHAVYAWIQTAQSLKYKSITKTIIISSNDSPTIDLTAAKSSALSSEKFDITATASDNDGIASVVISRQGTVLKTCNGAVPCTVTVGPFPSGSTVSFDALATDLLGAVSTTTGATVTIQ